MPEANKLSLSVSRKSGTWAPTVKTSRNGRKSMEYQSPFEDWYTYSTVHKPLPDFTCEAGLMLFPPELVPGVGHPLVDRLGRHATRRLTMRKLESYNAFTEKLEYQAVMAASIKLAQHPQAFGLSERAGREARLIVTDESHHAYVAVELMKRLPGASELPQLTPSQPRFLRGLEEFGRGLAAEFADDLLIAFVSISETLITSILRGIPRDPRVVSAVRNTVRDHCIDEARHHSYFVYVVHEHWASSWPDRRETLGPLYANLIRLFLDPDLDLCRDWLTEAGLDRRDAELATRHPPRSWVKMVAPAKAAGHGSPSLLTSSMLERQFQSLSTALERNTAARHSRAIGNPYPIIRLHSLVPRSNAGPPARLPPGNDAQRPAAPDRRSSRVGVAACVRARNRRRMSRRRHPLLRCLRRCPNQRRRRVGARPPASTSPREMPHDQLRRPRIRW